LLALRYWGVLCLHKITVTARSDTQRAQAREYRNCEEQYPEGTGAKVSSLRGAQRRGNPVKYRDISHRYHAGRKKVLTFCKKNV
jgi:hypothetical protein